MEFTTKIQLSINEIAKLIGYSEFQFHKKEGFSMVRQLGKVRHPRFHLYGERKNGSILFRLHLDQKETLHEKLLDRIDIYDGDMVRAEVGRIQGILK